MATSVPHVRSRIGRLRIGVTLSVWRSSSAGSVIVIGTHPLSVHPTHPQPDFESPNAAILRIAAMPQLQEVFGIATTVNQLSYVDRGGLDERFAYLLRTERHIAVHGDSKQGKS